MNYINTLMLVVQFVQILNSKSSILYSATGIHSAQKAVAGQLLAMSLQLIRGQLRLSVSLSHTYTLLIHIYTRNQLQYSASSFHFSFAFSLSYHVITSPNQGCKIPNYGPHESRIIMEHVSTLLDND